jgi:hypothetical protein
MDEYTSEIFMGGKNTLVIHNTVSDVLQNFASLNVLHCLYSHIHIHTYKQQCSWPANVFSCTQQCPWSSNISLYTLTPILTSHAVWRLTTSCPHYLGFGAASGASDPHWDAQGQWACFPRFPSYRCATQLPNKGSVGASGTMEILRLASRICLIRCLCVNCHIVFWPWLA